MWRKKHLLNAIQFGLILLRVPDAEYCDNFKRRLLLYLQIRQIEPENEIRTIVSRFSEVKNAKQHSSLGLLSTRHFCLIKAELA